MSSPRRTLCIVVIAGGFWSVAPRVSALEGEGFSEAFAAIPGNDGSAWLATVQIRTQGPSSPDDGSVTRIAGSATGLVLAVDESDACTAWIVTNAHVVDPNGKACEIQVGFSSVAGPSLRVWSHAAIVDLDRGRDLALLEAGIPTAADVAVLPLASPSCLAKRHEPTISLGWPDLSERVRWMVEPPSDAGLLAGRWSRGGTVRVLPEYRLVIGDRVAEERIGALFHTADMLPGSSGGPVLDRRGRVVGINARVLHSRPTEEGRPYCCAPPDEHRIGIDCVHLAIASETIAEFVLRAVNVAVPVAECSRSGGAF